MTKPSIVVKIPGCKLLYIIQVKESFWPYLISKVLVAYNHSYNTASDRPHTFYSQVVLFRSVPFKVRLNCGSQIFTVIN